MYSSNEQLISTCSSLSPVMVGIASVVDETAQPPLTTAEASIVKSSSTAPLDDKQDLQQDQASGETGKAIGGREIYQPAMRIEIPAVPTPSTETTDGFFTLRPWQSRCSTELAGHRNFILNAPTAAGKTFQLCAIAAERLSQDSDLRVVIAAPQGIITAGFRHNKIEMPDGTRVHWEVHPKHDLCGANSGQSTARLLKFLTGPASTKVMDRVILCTHATLVRAFGKNTSAFKGVLIIIDEAHHVRHATDQHQQFDINNKLGALVKHALHNRESIQIGLATATFFRGDRAPIIPDGAEFARFDLAYDEYLATCQFLRSFSYDFVTSCSSFVEPLKHLFDRKSGKTIVYIPAVNSSSSLGSKAADVNAVLKAIAGTDTPLLADTDQPIMRVKRGDKWIRVVNLVDPENRSEKTEAIVAAHNAPDPDHLDVVIALGMLKEGANWRWADRAVIIGHRGSLTEILQMNGRILRDVAGKTTAEVFHILPFRFDQVDRERTRQELNDYLTAILLSMLLENVMSPVYLPAAEKNDGQGGGGRRIDYLKEAFADEGQAIAALAEITARVVDASANDGGATDIRTMTDSFQVIVSEVLTSRGVHERQEEIARQLFRVFNRRTVTLEGLNVGHIDVDLIKENPFGCLLQYTSDACGIKTFRDLRVASRAKTFLPLANARAFVHGLGLKSVREWSEYCASGKRPAEIPSNPDLAYEHDGWKGYGDWLGTGRLRLGGQHHRPFDEARRFAQALAMRSKCEWKQYCKSGMKPADIPAAPHQVYRDVGWNGWGDWLGTGTVSTSQREFCRFQDAREFVRGRHLTSYAEWLTYCKSGEKPSDIPSNPHKVYRQSGWKNYRDWLGTQNTTFRSFHDARLYVQGLQLSTYAHWCEYCKSGDKPKDIPSGPAIVYKDQGWNGFGDWLGTGNVGPRNHDFRSFAEARRYARELGLASASEWREFCKSGRKPADIPATPNQVYRDAGWAGFNDWLMGESGLACVAA